MGYRFLCVYMPLKIRKEQDIINSNKIINIIVVPDTIKGQKNSAAVRH